MSPPESFPDSTPSSSQTMNTETSMFVSNRSRSASSKNKKSSSMDRARSARRSSSQHHRQYSAEEHDALSRELSRSSMRSKKRRDPRWWKVRLFKGMIDDVKRRAPYYWSDWRDAWDYRVVPATVYMYFAKYEISLIKLTHFFTQKQIHRSWLFHISLFPLRFASFTCS